MSFGQVGILRRQVGKICHAPPQFPLRRALLYMYSSTVGQKECLQVGFSVAPTKGAGKLKSHFS